MTSLRFVSAEQVEALLDPAALRTALTEAMIGLSSGRADVPPRVGARSGSGMLAVMPGFLDGVGLAAKLVSIFPGNVDVPSHQGLIVVVDAGDGTPRAVMDAEVITTVRTSVTAAIAADVLARADAGVLTIVGGGAQAAGHAKAFAGIRPWSEVRTVNRSQPAAAVASAAKEAGAASVVTVDDFEPAVRGADVVALCTHAEAAVIDAGWVGAGCHVSSVGSAAELPVGVLGRGPLVVEWRGAVAEPPPAGAAELQHLDPADAVELGELLQDRSLGRRGDDQITVYKSTGHAVEDVAAAALVYRAALEGDVGTVVGL